MCKECAIRGLSFLKAVGSFQLRDYENRGMILEDDPSEDVVNVRLYAPMAGPLFPEDSRTFKINFKAYPSLNTLHSESNGNLGVTVFADATPPFKATFRIKPQLLSI